MVIITGEKPYGTCDVVPDLFYVATIFFHFDYIPLVPLRSMLITRKQGGTYYGVQIPMSFKSVLLAWGRMGTFFAGVILWIIALVQMNDRFGDGGWAEALFALAATAVFLVLMIVPRKRRPSYERACKLARLANFTPTGWAALNVLYGRDPLEGTGINPNDLLRPTEAAKSN